MGGESLRGSENKKEIKGRKRVRIIWRVNKTSEFRGSDIEVLVLIFFLRVLRFSSLHKKLESEGYRFGSVGRPLSVTLVKQSRFIYYILIIIYKPLRDLWRRTAHTLTWLSYCSVGSSSRQTREYWSENQWKTSDTRSEILKRISRLTLSLPRMLSSKLRIKFCKMVKNKQ